MTSPAADVAVIGLGELGGQVAVRLAQSGRSVAVCDRDGGRVRRAVDAGGGLVTDGRDRTVPPAPVVLCLLPDSEVTMAVLGEAARTPLDGVTIVDLSTGDPGLAWLIEQLVAPAGATYLAATVLRGGAHEARLGELELAVGGAPDAVEAARGTLDLVGRMVVVLPSAPQAQVLKLVNNYIALGVSALTAEAVAVAQAAGIESADCLTWLAQGSAANWVSLAQLRLVAAGAGRPPEPAGFRAALAAKDVRYFVGSASRHGVPATIAGAVNGVYAEAAFTGNAATEAGGWPWRRLAGTGTAEEAG